MQKRIREEKKMRRSTVKKFFAVTFLLGALVFGNIYLRTEINIVQNEINKANKEIVRLESIEAAYKVKIENLYSYKTLIKKAEELGMQKENKNQIHYIKVEAKNYAEVISDN